MKTPDLWRDEALTLPTLLPAAYQEGIGEASTPGPQGNGGPSASASADGWLTTAPGLPLLGAAQPLLLALAHLKQGLAPEDPEALRQRLMEELKAFTELTAQRGVDPATVTIASQLLCTALDEAASATAWGQAACWPSRGLLASLHGVTDGGDRVFLALEQAARDAVAQHALLALYHCVLALGLNGRFGLAPHGPERLLQLRRRLHQLLGGSQPGITLSPSARGLTAPPHRWRDSIPIWVAAALLGLPWCAGFSVERRALAREADDSFQRLLHLRLPDAPAIEQMRDVHPMPLLDQWRKHLTKQLQDDLDNGRLQLVASTQQLIIRLPGDRFFASGSSSIQGNQEGLLGRLAAALSPLPARILITGYTDGQPISNSQFSSNWDLSRARADNVRTMLATQVPPDRLKTRGLGGMNSIADNNTAQGRASNRRVEITLMLPVDKEQP